MTRKNGDPVSIPLTLPKLIQNEKKNYEELLISSKSYVLNLRLAKAYKPYQQN